MNEPGKTCGRFCPATWGVLAFLVVGIVAVVLQRRGPESGPESIVVRGVEDPAVDRMLIRASSACLAEITSLEDLDERPSDGDHWVKASLKIIAGSGDVPEFIVLTRARGGHTEFGDHNPLPAKLRYDSLNVGERHWFVFGTEGEGSDFPYGMTGWWPEQADDFPASVARAVKLDRFARRPVFDKQSKLIYDWKETDQGKGVQIRVLNDAAVVWEKTISGQPYKELAVLQAFHHPFAYEMEFGDPPDCHVLLLRSTGMLDDDHPSGLSAGMYRLQHAFELSTGRRRATWIAKNEASWSLHYFEQFDAGTGHRILAQHYSQESTGGLEAGGETDEWRRKLEERFDAESGKLETIRVFRYGPKISPNGDNTYYDWIPIETTQGKGGLRDSDEQLSHYKSDYSSPTFNGCRSSGRKWPSRRISSSSNQTSPPPYAFV